MTDMMAIVMITLLCLINIMVDWLILVMDSKKLTKRSKMLLLLLTSISTIAGLSIMMLVGYVQPVFNDSMGYHEVGIERIRDRDFIAEKMQSGQADSLDKARESRKFDGTELDGTELPEMTDKLSVIATPDLLGMYEQAAINFCVQRGYTCELEYYLGCDGTVISQFPTAVNSMEIGDDIMLNIGVPENEFSDKLLALINKRRRILGVEELCFSDQLNTACTILAQENVGSRESACLDDSHWLLVISENNISLREGTFMTISSISSLSDANERIWQNKDGEGSSLLIPSFSKIGMAYTDNNTLIIIVGD